MLTRYFSAFAALFLTTAIAQADSITADGVTYSLTETTTSVSTTDQFLLAISDINGPSDIKSGRYGVQSFAFNKPSNFSTATAPSGFTEKAGGLNDSGCNTNSKNAKFFCFSAVTDPVASVLAYNSTLSYSFSVTLTSGTFSGYNPDFKIHWLGTGDYSLVSRRLMPSPGASGTPVPEPGSLIILGTALIGLGLVLPRGRNRS